MTSPSKTWLEVLDADGAVIVEECFSAELIEQILSELAPHIEKPDSNRTHINPIIADFYGEHTRHVTGLCSKSPTFVAEVLLHPADARRCRCRTGARAAPTTN